MLYQVRTYLPGPLREFLRRIRAAFLSIGLSGDARFSQPESEAAASSQISIVIPVLDSPLLRRCLASLEQYAPKAEVILVDDGSEFEETKTLMREFVSRNAWKIVCNEKPLGHSRATEAGTRLATRPYLCLLNSDTVVTPWSWQAALEAFESDAEIAVTGPTTSHATTPQMIKRAELCRHYWTDAQVFAFAKKYTDSITGCRWVDLSEAGGFAFFIRRNIWEELGGFDPKLPDYGNEVELCRRVSKMGKRIVWTKKSYIHHFGNQTYSGPRFGPDFIKEKSLRALEYIEEKHGG